ncbi:MAG: HPr family phosphocarrier protein [Candidatus Omnitrophica bacterium]|nr:HPr family phosphocarrier protein [Candidatus Omnitrophota bacterium]
MKKTVVVRNPMGLHARPASVFVKIANQYDADVHVAKDGQSVNGKSIMGILMLAAEQGSEVSMETTGPEAAAAMEALEAFLTSVDASSEAGGLV